MSREYRYATPSRDRLEDLATGQLIRIPLDEPLPPIDLERRSEEDQRRFRRSKELWDFLQAGGKPNPFSGLPEELLRQRYAQEIQGMLGLFPSSVLKEALDLLNSHLNPSSDA